MQMYEERKILMIKKDHSKAIEILKEWQSKEISSSSSSKPWKK